MMLLKVGIKGVMVVVKVVIAILGKNGKAGVKRKWWVLAQPPYFP